MDWLYTVGVIIVWDIVRSIAVAYWTAWKIKKDRMEEQDRKI